MTDHELLQALYNDMQDMKGDMQTLKADMQTVKQKVTNIESHTENVINRCIQMIAEGHFSLKQKFNKSLGAEKEDKETFIVHVHVSGNELQKIRERLI